MLILLANKTHFKTSLCKLRKYNSDKLEKFFLNKKYNIKKCNKKVNILHYYFYTLLK